MFVDACFYPFRTRVRLSPSPPFNFIKNSFERGELYKAKLCLEFERNSGLVKLGKRGLKVAKTQSSNGKTERKGISRGEIPDG